MSIDWNLKLSATVPLKFLNHFCDSIKEKFVRKLANNMELVTLKCSTSFNTSSQLLHPTYWKSKHFYKSIR